MINWNWFHLFFNFGSVGPFNSLGLDPRTPSHHLRTIEFIRWKSLIMTRYENLLHIRSEKNRVGQRLVQTLNSPDWTSDLKRLRKTTEKLDSHMRVSSFSNAYERLYDARTDYGLISWLLICAYYLSFMSTIWTKWYGWFGRIGFVINQGDSEIFIAEVCIFVFV